MSGSCAGKKSSWSTSEGSTDSPESLWYSLCPRSEDYESDSDPLHPTFSRSSSERSLNSCLLSTQHWVTDVTAHLHKLMAAVENIANLRHLYSTWWPQILRDHFWWLKELIHGKKTGVKFSSQCHFKEIWVTVSICSFKRSLKKCDTLNSSYPPGTTEPKLTWLFRYSIYNYGICNIRLAKILDN